MTRRLQEVHGTIMIRQHCTFGWRQPESAYQRVVDIEDRHCPACILELAKQSGFLLNDLRTKKAKSAID